MSSETATEIKSKDLANAKTMMHLMSISRHLTGVVIYFSDTSTNAVKNTSGLVLNRRLEDAGTGLWNYRSGLKICFSVGVFQTILYNS